MINNLRELYSGSIDIFRSMPDCKSRQDFFVSCIFSNLIDNCFETISSAGMKKIFDTKDGDLSYISQNIGDSLMFNFIFFIYSLLETIDKKYLKEHPLYILRSKFAHGESMAPFNTSPNTPAPILSGKEAIPLLNSKYSYGSENNQYFFGSIWQIRENNGKYFNSVNGESFNDCIKAKESLIQLLKNDEIFIDSSGNFIVNITKLYSLTFNRLDEFIKRELRLFSN